MYNKQLDTFLMVAKTVSFSKASEALYITPSAVIQQINNLERELEVSLFTRTKRGAKLTPAGEYLFKEGEALVQFCGGIRRQLSVLAKMECPEVCVGTTLLMKCRLFYELWKQFSRENQDYRVKMINMDAGEEDYKQADLVEGVKDGEMWQKNMEFLELCSVPIACAVPKKHELACRKVLTFEDMRGRTMVTIEKGLSEILDRLGKEAAERGVHVTYANWYNLPLFGMCVVNGYLLQTPLCWQDIHPDLVTIPCQWEYSLPYGFHYRKNPSRVLERFLDFAGKNWDRGGVKVGLGAWQHIVECSAKEGAEK